jgi:MoxR-vWA-beta-propeller ternary system domain bpX4
MSLAAFLSSLLETGRVTAPLPEDLSDEDAARADAVLASFEQTWRLEMPGDPPSLSAPAARWAAVLFFRACQFAVYRDLGPDLVERELAVACPVPPSPSSAYSVDLVFRLLPDLLRFAQSAAEKDPLVEHLRRLAREWPLSSVGVANLGPVDVSSFVEDPSLSTLYADRVLAARDATRLGGDRVKEALRRAVGLHPALAGEWRGTLEEFKVLESAP